MQNLSYENEFDFHENEHVGGMHFHINGFTQRLILTQRQKTYRKRPVMCMIVDSVLTVNSNKIFRFL